MQLRISCNEGCCYWPACFVQTEVVSIIGSHGSLRHVRERKEIAEMGRSFWLSGQPLFFRPFSLILTSLTSESTAVTCLSLSLSIVGAVVQVGRCVSACGGIPSSLPPDRLHSSELPQAGRWSASQGPSGGFPVFCLAYRGI